MFGLGITEILVIFVIALIVFGPKKLPELGKSIGRAMAEFKKAQQEFQNAVQSEMKEVEKETNLEEIKKLGKIEIPDYNKPEPGESTEAKDAGQAAADQAGGQKQEERRGEETKGDA